MASLLLVESTSRMRRSTRLMVLTWRCMLQATSGPAEGPGRGRHGPMLWSSEGSLHVHVSIHSSGCFQWTRCPEIRGLSHTIATIPHGETQQPQQPQAADEILPSGLDPSGQQGAIPPRTGPTARLRSISFTYLCCGPALIQSECDNDCND